MKRCYTVKIDGIEYYAEGSFSYGAFNAGRDILEKVAPNYLIIPGGRIVSYDNGYEQWYFESINHAEQLGKPLWVQALN
jgi:hypothetical protein